MAHPRAYGADFFRFLTLFFLPQVHPRIYGADTKFLKQIPVVSKPFFRLGLPQQNQYASFWPGIFLRITLFGQYWPEMIHVLQSSCGAFQDVITFSYRLRLFWGILKHEFNFYLSVCDPGYLQFCIKGRPLFGLESGDLRGRRGLVSAGSVLFDALR